MSGGLRIVQQGLAKAGDRVVVDGVQKVLMPGMSVNAKNVDMARNLTPIASEQAQ